MNTHHQIHRARRTVGRNSHVPACLECRARKAKVCSKTQPCGPCVRHGRTCVYASKVARTPLTREHLTAVETRLQILESALGKLFPAGDIQAITLDLLHSEPSSTNLEDEPAQSESAFLHDPSRQDLSSEALAGLSSPGTEGELHAGAGLTVSEQTQYLDNYFSYYHVLYPLLTEHSFRQAIASDPSAPAFRLLMQLVLAIGAWISPQSRPGVDRELFVEAQNQLKKMPLAHQADLPIIQALILLSDLAQKLSSAEESDHYTGTALRLALSMSLHTEPLAGMLSELDKEVRRRVWWSVYCAESCSAKLYGRPLLLPEDKLITVNVVSNIQEKVPKHCLHRKALTPSSTTLPPQTDDTTIYTGLIQQSSYHRMANNIYRRFLSTPSITPANVDQANQTIDDWHRSSSFCVQVGHRSSRPEWHFVARRRQILCDRSLRLLIHRPMLLQWLRWRQSSPSQSASTTTTAPSELDQAYQSEAGDAEDHAHARCRAQGLEIARTTIATITELISNHRQSQLTLAFTLCAPPLPSSPPARSFPKYALFHALLVPLVHMKADPWSSVSISCVHDLDKAKTVLDHLPIENDAQTRYFATALRYLLEIATSTKDKDNDDDKGQSGLGGCAQTQTQAAAVDVAVRGVQGHVNNDIFDSKELALLETTRKLGVARELDFSDWLDL
ncbi:fungal-specific transcription factor domain-containing protein [Aspergillus venezuelensis]